MDRRLNPTLGLPTSVRRCSPAAVRAGARVVQAEGAARRGLSRLYATVTRMVRLGLTPPRIAHALGSSPARLSRRALPAHIEQVVAWTGPWLQPRRGVGMDDAQLASLLGRAKRLRWALWLHGELHPGG